MNFEDELKSLVYFHLEEHASGRHLLQVLEEDDFARDVIAPQEGIKKSSFFEAINSRGLDQFIQVFEALQAQASKVLPKAHETLGDLVAIDGSLIDSVLSMYWADYREGSKKAKVHVGFDINRGIPKKIFLTDGKADERPFATRIMSPGETGVMDRYYQCHKNFDLWQRDEKQFLCRIRAGSNKTVIKHNDISPGSDILANNAIIVPEINAHGLAVLQELRNLGYPNIYRQRYYDHTSRQWARRLGWKTTKLSKPLMVDEFMKGLREEEIGLSSQVTVNQMLTFVHSDDSGKHGMGAEEGQKDDCLIGAMLAWQGLADLPSKYKG